jgi:hypothetical protein
MAFAGGSLVLALALATCGGEPSYDCSESGRAELYQRRIEPLLEEDRPKSCNQCHLSGVDLGAFVKDTPCQTMACLVEKGIVDLSVPENSLLLAWIDRAQPDSAGITSDVLAEERAGVEEWIRMTAECGVCNSDPNPCGDADPSQLEGCKVEGEVEDVIAADPGDCSLQTLEEVFRGVFFTSRGRCYPCHFEEFGAGIADAPKWVAIGPCETAAASTMRRIINAGYLDRESPSQSLWLRKPLDPEAGGLEHGGGVKIHSTDEDLYVGMSHFATRWAGCP